MKTRGLTIKIRAKKPKNVGNCESSAIQIQSRSTPTYPVYVPAGAAPTPCPDCNLACEACVLADYGQPFRNPVREGLPTIRELSREAGFQAFTSTGQLSVMNRITAFHLLP